MNLPTEPAPADRRIGRYLVAFTGAVILNFVVGNVVGLLLLGEGGGDESSVLVLMVLFGAVSGATGFFVGLVITRRCCRPLWSP